MAEQTRAVAIDRVLALAEAQVAQLLRWRAWHQRPTRQRAEDRLERQRAFLASRTYQSSGLYLPHRGSEEVSS